MDGEEVGGDECVSRRRVSQSHGPKTGPTFEDGGHKKQLPHFGEKTSFRTVHKCLRRDAIEMPGEWMRNWKTEMEQMKWNQ